MKFFLELCLVLLCIAYVQSTIVIGVDPVDTCKQNAAARCKDTESCGRIIGSNLCRYFLSDCNRQLTNCNRVANGLSIFQKVQDNLCLGVPSGSSSTCNSPAPA